METHWDRGGKEGRIRKEQELIECLDRLSTWKNTDKGTEVNEKREHGDRNDKKR